MIICDSKQSNRHFIDLVKARQDLIPQKKHISKNGNTISEINQIHSDLRRLNRLKKGISSRHLPDYLNWYCFLKKLIYSTEAKRRKIQAYIDIMPSKKILTNSDICKIPMPVDLYKAYGEYHYGIYANTQQFQRTLLKIRLNNYLIEKSQYLIFIFVWRELAKKLWNISLNNKTQQQYYRHYYN